MTALQIAGIALAVVVICHRVRLLVSDLRRIRELRRELREIEAEAAFNEHLMHTEWLLLEVTDRVDERGRFEWEA